jgi:hypothetical protein
MKRSPMPPRTKPMSRSRIRPKKRSAAETRDKFADEYGSKERRDWITLHGCLACGRAPSENAHAWNRGKSRKGPPESIVPLCHHHHIEDLHQHGVKTFEKTHWRMLAGRTLVEWAGSVDREWQRYSNPEKLSSIVPRVVARITGEDAE